MKTTVLLGQGPTACPVHAPLQPTLGYTLSLRRPHLHGLWGLQAGSLVPISVSVGLEARRSALGGWLGLDFRCRCPVHPPVSQQPVALLCAESQSLGPPVQAAVLGQARTLWPRGTGAEKEHSDRFCPGGRLQALPTISTHTPAARLALAGGLGGTTVLKQSPNPQLISGDQERLQSRSRRRRCPAQPQAQAPRVPACHGCPRPGPDLLGTPPEQEEGEEAPAQPQAPRESPPSVAARAPSPD